MAREFKQCFAVELTFASLLLHATVQAWWIETHLTTPSSSGLGLMSCAKTVAPIPCTAHTESDAQVRQQVPGLVELQLSYQIFGWHGGATGWTAEKL